jgi:hypothetical protein
LGRKIFYIHDKNHSKPTVAETAIHLIKEVIEEERRKQKGGELVCVSLKK